MTIPDAEWNKFLTWAVEYKGLDMYPYRWRAVMKDFRDEIEALKVKVAALEAERKP